MHSISHRARVPACAPERTHACIAPTAAHLLPHHAACQRQRSLAAVAWPAHRQLARRARAWVAAQGTGVGAGALAHARQPARLACPVWRAAHQVRAAHLQSRCVCVCVCVYVCVCAHARTCVCVQMGILLSARVPACSGGLHE